MIEEKTVAQIREAKKNLDLQIGSAVSEILNKWQKENGIAIDGIDLDFRTFQNDAGEKITQLVNVNAKIERI